jgi:hypothetical protein
VKKTKTLKQKISCCISGQVIPKVWKDCNAFFFRLNNAIRVNESECTVILQNVRNCLPSSVVPRSR